MKPWHYIIIIISAVLLACFLSGWGGYAIAQKNIKPKVITTIEERVDTHTIYKPRLVVQKVVEKQLVPVLDTLHIHDTLFVAMDRESKEYADSEYRAIVSGIFPSLDLIEVYPKTTIVTQTIVESASRKPTRFGIGMQVGFGACYGLVNKQVDAGPYIGVGISYNFVRF